MTLKVTRCPCSMNTSIISLSEHFDTSPSSSMYWKLNDPSSISLRMRAFASGLRDSTSFALYPRNSANGEWPPVEGSSRSLTNELLVASKTRSLPKNPLPILVSLLYSKTRNVLFVLAVGRSYRAVACRAVACRVVACRACRVRRRVLF